MEVKNVNFIEVPSKIIITRGYGRQWGEEISQEMGTKIQLDRKNKF